MPESLPPTCPELPQVPSPPPDADLPTPQPASRADPNKPAARSVVVALLTPPGRGALAVVGLCGPGSCGVADRLFRPRGGLPLADRRPGSLAFGNWQSLPDAASEELVVVKRSADSIEVHCHGGAAAADAVIGSLVSVGADRLPLPAWLEAAGFGEIEREARAALAVAAGPKAARILCRQLGGALAAELERLGTAGSDREAGVERLLRAARVGLRLIRPWQVVLAGAVNAGKSSLANALIGYARSIVSAEPGTTRDLVSTPIVLGGWEVDLIDTAGVREAARGATERAGIERAERASREADLVLRVVPGDDANSPGGFASPASDRELVVVTKADLVGQSLQPPPDGIVTSAVTGAGIEQLTNLIAARLVPEEAAEPDLLAGAVPFTDRQVEAIRRLAPKPA
jgi:tRNA modification GTPase